MTRRRRCRPGSENDEASSSGHPAGNNASAADNKAMAGVFKAIRMQGWQGIPVPRELQVGLYAFINPVWCLKPPLPSPVSGIVLQHHTGLVIDYSNTCQRNFWEQMTPQTAHELGKQMINLTAVTHRFPCSWASKDDDDDSLSEDSDDDDDDDYIDAPLWCFGSVIALIEGHALGQKIARQKQGLPPR
ncbi:unnamed protein product [Vitrella brassicaformis CCMP3155]|uniref:Uncharacterized protein n=1 Tax=Vitrella brassicaformis (strain CCMP3155) TaxID=1169540 RepID=A0A0G4EUT9_VITBC|nr:unnamed protein product [Vitrella brassicaformis CCMP3155]|eukprot:CEM02365.1 unnamed protein product [Vitrella brassicaformis CCMP3155]